MSDTNDCMPSTAAWLRILVTVLCLSVVGGLFIPVGTLAVVRRFSGFAEATPMEYAQLARGVAVEGEMITKCVRPSTISYLKNHAEDKDPCIERHPDILHAPLYPRHLAKVFGTDFRAGTQPSDARVMLYGSMVFCLFTLLVLVVTAGVAFDPRVAGLAGFVLLFSRGFWALAISGTAVPMAMFLSTLALGSAVVAAHLCRLGGARHYWFLPFALLAAFSASWAFLVRYGAIILIPVLMFYFAVGLKRFWRLAGPVILIVVFVLTTHSWFERNEAICGNRLGMAPAVKFIDHDPTPGDGAERALVPEPLPPRLTPLALRMKRLANGFNMAHEAIPSAGNGIIACLFFVSFFHLFRDKPVFRMRWAILGGLVLLISIAGIYGSRTAQLSVILWPIMSLYGLAFLFELLDRIPVNRVASSAIGIVVVLALQIVPLSVDIVTTRQTLPYPPYFTPFIEHVCQFMDDDEMLGTDIPWATSWYSDQLSLLVPATIDEFYEINDYMKPISGLYFTTETRDRPYVSGLIEGDKSWFPVQEGRVPVDFPLDQGFPLKGLDQLFLTDRPRWNEGEPLSKELSDKVFKTEW